MDMVLGKVKSMPDELITQAKAGDTNAWRILYDQNRLSVYSLCVRMCGNRHDAEDILQESFVSAFRKIGQLRDETIFGGWLRRITINHCLGFLRSQIVYKPIGDEPDPVEEDFGEDFLQSIPFADIQQAITGLPVKCRVVFVLVAMEEYSHQQVASALNISVSTSKSQYHRGKQLLKIKLSQHSKNG
jgi:RNA polymerase sigma factor (sigma-70 family)